jgi:hypothetical protein
MTSLRLWDRGGTRRLAALDAYQFPSSLRQRVLFQHAGLTGDTITAVEGAARQWFRLAARHPRAKLCMPSVVVGDYWREFRLYPREYAEFCDQAVGRLLQDDTTADTTADRGMRLHTTFRLAQQDEQLESHRLPTLFRVDHDLAITGARRYLADCGGHDQCYDQTDMLCLRHLVDVPRGRRSKWSHPGAPGAAGGFGGGCGMGCGGGCAG